MRSGICDSFVDQNTQMQSYYGVTLLGRYLMQNWKPRTDRLEIRIKLVMRDNVDDYNPEKNRDAYIML